MAESMAEPTMDCTTVETTPSTTVETTPSTQTTILDILLSTKNTQHSMDDTSKKENTAKIWKQVKIGMIIDEAAADVAHTLSEDDRENPAVWNEIMDAAFYRFTLAIEENQDFKEINHSVILERYNLAFYQTMVLIRFNDYCDDFKIKATASEPNEPTDVIITEEVYKQYFDKIDPRIVCNYLSSHAECYVRAKLTHRADTILAICKRAVLYIHDVSKYGSDYYIGNAQFYATESHYMADNPDAHMRFDDD